ncbi:MAG TPA: hypothetical protein VHE30_15930 [Polyangiaceae bacterium]|nr:hypothetical protein [Polyangiaceae bacterium]
MTARRRRIAVRDQRASEFSAVLLRLCDAASAIGAALVDAEGETVDYAGAIDPFDIKVAAAEWVIILAMLREAKSVLFRGTEEILLRGTKKSFFIQPLVDGYAVVVQLSPHAFSVSRRAVHEAIRDLCREAGFSLPPTLLRDRELWRRVDIRTEAGARRPSAIWVAGGWTALEVLGRFTQGLDRGDVGFRARLPTGAEVNLVRERLGRWYTDTDIAH